MRVAWRRSVEILSVLLTTEDHLYYRPDTFFGTTLPDLRHGVPSPTRPPPHRGRLPLRDGARHSHPTPASGTAGLTRSKSRLLQPRPPAQDLVQVRGSPCCCTELLNSQIYPIGSHQPPHPSPTRQPPPLARQPAQTAETRQHHAPTVALHRQSLRDPRARNRAFPRLLLSAPAAAAAARQATDNRLQRQRLRPDRPFPGILHGQRLADRTAVSLVRDGGDAT